ncbi:type II toxin-antitoxin system RelE family toxin [Caulobacter mirabilis]|uniref:Cytotoxic translational repressor of toxin-antitoxin stability system n=1 Tax=Caulobacter mirabilis TaxID=69666 RepID=A0A2D2AVZ3_9CAUL|nr:type II toxin-antitoxin system RelE/ParE family toxin [Caulobacter mirabilis]ATQ42170.1 cytotoxic translational repressor of toxin-antitoxin stability system [Caulobacter mirabilis]
MLAVSYSKQALRALRRMPANTATLIREKVVQYAADPASLANNVKTLRGLEDVKRLRVGDWRILFRDDGVVLAIIRIAPRGSAYD